MGLLNACEDIYALRCTCTLWWIRCLS